ncbi:hypothetical protein QBC44DRAFT_314749 [Cladorrhinum sp. PSN332]|nr:hypothetical protein QBC44DRAFT_314749 [Cladorrhinum sp. PSN332]
MATLDGLKLALRAATPSSCERRQLSDEEYSAGFDMLARSSQFVNAEFTISQLSELLSQLAKFKNPISILEVGPGPKTVLSLVPENLRRKIHRYVAFEPNKVFATALEESLAAVEGGFFPCLANRPDIRQDQFTLQTKFESEAEKFDLILFCHSMYGMKPESDYIKHSLKLLADDKAMVVVFHRESLDLGGSWLVAQQTASYPDGAVRLPRRDEEGLDSFAALIAGYSITEQDIKAEWRWICRGLGRQEQGNILLSSPEIMVAFTQHATALPELTAKVPIIPNRTVKNRLAYAYQPAAVMVPTKIEHVQECVRWAVKHGFGLTVLGGGHSDHCLVPNVVAIDMACFNKVSVRISEELVVAEAGCKTGDIIRQSLKTITSKAEGGLTVPLGARPSVGAGLWLQGGIGHLSRLHGLACDAIVGAVVVGVDTGRVLCIGSVPKEFQPAGSVRPENEADLLWGIKGAGTNFGILVSVTFKAFAAEKQTVRDWVIPDAQLGLKKVHDLVSGELPRNLAVDAFLYPEKDRLSLGVTMFESMGTEASNSYNDCSPYPGTGFGDPVDGAPAISDASTLVLKALGPESKLKVMDSVDLFEADMYMSGMHGGHGGSKTSAFKRCVFLKQLNEVSESLMTALNNRPTPLCYLHLLHGGGAVQDVPSRATAFGARDWEFACVITGVWPRHQDGTHVSRSAIEWVYKTVEALLQHNSSARGGIYGADLGPDPRDALLAARAFGQNLTRLVRLKLTMDPHNVLRYTCPLPKASMEPTLIILVTGESGAGKDYAANLWASLFQQHKTHPQTARQVSISEETKREYAKAYKSDIFKLLHDRNYKENHRGRLTSFFHNQLEQDPKLLEKHFVSAVLRGCPADVVLITGMRDEYPVASFCHLVPNSRVIEVRVTASRKTRLARGATDWEPDNSNSSSSSPPTFTFANDKQDNTQQFEEFFTKSLFPLVSPELTELSTLIRAVPSFPHHGITFQHVLGIAQHPGGLKLATSLLASLYHIPWDQISHVVAAEAGGFIFASPLAYSLDKSLAVIRKSCGNNPKLPPPLVSVTRDSGKEGKSHISGCLDSGDGSTEEESLEMDRDVIPKDAKVVIVDDVLATGRTLCSVLELLVAKVGVKAENVSVLVVAEFPVHRGREMLRNKGFGRVGVGSLVVFGGV